MIRSVMVVLPDPVPPQMPIISELVRPDASRVVSGSLFFLDALLLAALFFQNRLRGGQLRYRNAKRGRAHVVHADLVAEPHAFRVSAVLAANADFELGASLSAALDAHFNELADAFDIQALERVALEDARLLLVHVIGQES